ncbi:SDR family NAD(P)-dependent oxidoreductase [Prescottella agglutinans]|uniref:Short-subunit dehydrogenase n=1 Tax=Prescottella agglutinans TaxID=1644129 RepID=A0ABT6M7Q0_9NOCA|nr:SDR family NAD(P)-dependent oxidoreductase [Prescottella agglutinans]MDH6280332.1 short-subunit dehydrogenase [Prescottella agglutinans]
MNDSETNGTRALALVTGASTGIGYELARGLAARRYDLVLVADDDAVRPVAAEFAPQGITAHAIEADLATNVGLAEVRRSLDALERPIGVAALNAGIGAHGRFDRMSIDDDLRMIALNVTATVRLAKYVLRPMVDRGEGRVLFTSSSATAMPGPLCATYAASTAFVQSFADAVRTELADTGVAITTLMPGATDTDFFDRAGMQDTALARGPKADPEDVAQRGLEALFAGNDCVEIGVAQRV